MSERELEIILYGATGFTGQQSAKYFAEHVGTRLRWGLGGRNLEKLRKVRASLGEAFVDLPLIEADSQDLPALRELSGQSQVVLSTAGPFALHGEKLVQACLDTGTDYLDITGETPWVRHLIDTHQARAERKGVRIIPFCGVDSIPSDLMTLWMARQAQRQLGEPCQEVVGLFKVRGGLNGGTLASLLQMAQAGQLEALERPYLLNPGEEQVRQTPADPIGLSWDPHWWAWTSPFVMAAINTRVVRRSEALYRLAGQSYGAGGESFVYREAAWSDELLPAKALMAAGGMLTLQELLRIPQATQWLQKIGPKPGEGPSEQTMEQGFLSAWFRSHTASGHVAKGHFFCAGDPGNRVTVKLLCESALLLVEQRKDLPAAFAGGVLTPATGLGEALLERLQAAGVRLSWQAE